MTDPEDPTIVRRREGDAPTIEGFADLDEIGRGGFSVVYAATELAFQRRVAVKVLQGGADEARRLQRESLALGALSGIPHVITPYSIVRTSDGRPALVLPLFPRSLASTLRGGSRPAVEEVLRWGGQLAVALDAAHARSIHHRDIKPENVLISDAGDAYLADFGIAAVDGLDAATVTVASLSPQHAPPERFLDQDVDPAAGDRYSLASTLYTALSGNAPFGSAAQGGVLGLMNRVANDPVPPLAENLRWGDEVFARALGKVPANRFSSAVEYMADLSAKREPDVGEMAWVAVNPASSVETQATFRAHRVRPHPRQRNGEPDFTAARQRSDGAGSVEDPTILRANHESTRSGQASTARHEALVYEVPPWHAHRVAASLHAIGIHFSWKPDGSLVTNGADELEVERVLSGLPPLEYPSALQELLTELRGTASRLAANHSSSKDIVRTAELTGLLRNIAIPPHFAAASWRAVVAAAGRLTGGLESTGSDIWTDDEIVVAACQLRDVLEFVLGAPR